tara:strand:- start:676 stop:1416 length:741 start_codon:yes stop_codon:yes gene_type:complete
MKSKRTHDQLYLNEYRYDEPKETFKFLAQKAFMQEDKGKNLNICDVGCAAGEFLYYLRSILPNARLTGIDIMPELIEKCSQFVPSAELEVGSVLDSELRSTNEFDLTFLVGVHSIFDEFETCFDNLINWTVPGGSIYIFGMFNPYPLDVLIKHKESTEYTSDIYESGWNIFSQQSVTSYLEKKEQVKSVAFHEFEIGIDMLKQEDPVRSWTFQTYSGNRIITNGLCLLEPFYLLEIKLLSQTECHT